jgi:3-deoxy-manno-octulosonate cytidylyltransferase (CMP-KDO synthetase)
MARFTVVIPARYGSTRLPGKVLAPIGGRSMLEWVWQRARASAAQDVLIATDDERVASVAESFGAGVVRTRDDHASGTLRIAEVAERLEWPASRIVVNVQADEPFLDPALIDQVGAALAKRAQVQIATLAQRITTLHDLNDVSAVKVVTDREGHALYFSRAMIPWPRNGVPDVLLLAEDPPWRRHIGVYAYRAGFLREYARWKPAPLEELEGLEQLRALWHGARIHVSDVANAVPGGVDTPEDLERARALAERGGVL